jgi:hypothetical protein
MKHFRDVKWNETVRLPARDLIQETMKNHWRPRPVWRVKSARTWERVAHAAAAEPRYQPAAKSVRVVKASFAGASLKPRPEEGNGRVQLLFDSFSQPGPAGIRSADTRVRQLLYRADPYQIDLHIEVQPENKRLLITGQLVDVSHPELVGRDVQVMLSDGREFIVNTLTNQFGEFSFDVKNSKDLELSFLARGAKPIVILLPGSLDLFSGARE